MMMIAIVIMIASYTNDDDRYCDHDRIAVIMVMIASYTNDDDRHRDDDRIVHK